MVEEYFPMALPVGVTGHLMVWEEAKAHIEKIGGQVFPPGFKQALGLFEAPAERRGLLDELEKQYVRAGIKWIVFMHPEDGPVGWFYGYMEDEETFFIDTIGVVPAYQRRGLYSAFLLQLKGYLRAEGFERIATTHHPNNRGALIADLKAGFNIAGLELHEGRGPQVRMAVGLHPDRRRAFEAVFSVEGEDE